MNFVDKAADCEDSKNELPKLPQTKYEKRQNLTGNYSALLGSRGSLSFFFNLAYSRPESAVIYPFILNHVPFIACRSCSLEQPWQQRGVSCKR